MIDVNYSIDIMKQEAENKYISPQIKYAFNASIKALKKEIPLKIIKIEGISSQACPICRADANWKYCSNCGQKLSY